MFTKSGRKSNGSLLYTIRPIQEALDLFYERQMARTDEDVAKQRVAAKLAKFAPVSRRVPTEHARRLPVHPEGRSRRGVNLR